ncbi:uncharacterized protein LOC119690222 [Teleopsis dalmanni]|uniref:uncharacterized protein LOC119690222 n=1 Tax=Teleopsis dalmanni TaxID=139649 RepID=UPI0018CEE2BF|nr:uncharacterized protein LOC119690222 [Teleopsis dalmanni]
MSGVGICVMCFKFASHVCQTCGDYYCSVTCQALDWRTHRFICKRMPKLEVMDPIKKVREWLKKNDQWLWHIRKFQHDMLQQNLPDSRNILNFNSPQQSNAYQNQSQQNYSESRRNNCKQTYQNNQGYNEEIQQKCLLKINVRHGQSLDESSNAPVLKAPFEIIKLNENGTNFLAYVVDTSCIREGLFACIPYKHYPSFINMQIFLAKLGKGGQPYKPTFTEYCIVLVREQWYRAKVIGAYGNEFKVEYIDFANDGWVKPEHIRRYPLGLTYVNSTSLCRLAGLPDKLDSKLSNQLEDIIVNIQKLQVQTVKKCDDFFEIECPVLLKQFSKLGFI